jgi:hypothetical protein
MKKEPYRGMKKHCKPVRSWEEAGCDPLAQLDPGFEKNVSGYAKHNDSKLDGKMIGVKLSYKKRARQNKKNNDMNVKRARIADQGSFLDFPRYNSFAPSGKSDVHGFPYDAEMSNVHNLGMPVADPSFHNKTPSQFYSQQHGHGNMSFLSSYEAKVGNGTFSRPSLERESMINIQQYNMMGHGQGPRRNTLKVETKKFFVPANFENTVEVSRDNSKTLLEQVLSSEILQWDNPSHFPPENDFLPSTPETMPMVNRVSSPISIFEAATAAMHYRS